MLQQYAGEIQKAADLLCKSCDTAAFCGSGVSAESGISTFRDPGGIWDRLDMSEVGTAEGLFATLGKNPGKLMPVFIELLDTLEKASFNPGHEALAWLQSGCRLGTIITQNVDNLQQEAGSTCVIEVHGNLFEMACLSCNKKRKMDRKLLIHDLRKRLGLMRDISLPGLVSLVPRCESCGSLMRPDIVMFGEAVKEMPRSFEIARECDVMLVLGTSGVVYPAAELPYEAMRAGASIIVINPHENAFFDISDVYIPMKTGVALPAIVEMIKSIKLKKR
ncbi:MAG TPA: Sir2 family NAD-dependent protein deacetylase [Spirochaetota bacterium]|nr:NAD-dependent protein deacylase [Spirochaetota bacterium]HOD13797.1 Sir2 family NAD-dependent protein deacetylase [Spirochaetota bacterium]HPG50958.1 Sir2 family NAD-dependent protein deacetylase [Spirochaetota bacterium]HPN11587.1 Sir2 family NAD-dependent protein deacetylase [Spirochaetota bacterium]HQL81480.1 Sir2 family NAD-dependent protein deacetylase [Spirochaetota bacterium]